MNYMEKEALFFDYVRSLADELLIVASYHYKHSTMLTMVFIDIGSQIWKEFRGERTEKNREAFKKWCNEFMPKDVYNSDDLYKLRCSLLHFGGIPKPFMFEEHYQSELSQHPTRFHEITSDTDVKRLNSEQFMQLTANGFIDMLKCIDTQSKRNNQLYVPFLDTMAKKIEKEGSFMLSS